MWALIWHHARNIKSSICTWAQASCYILPTSIVQLWGLRHHSCCTTLQAQFKPCKRNEMHIENTVNKRAWVSTPGECSFKVSQRKGTKLGMNPFHLRQSSGLYRSCGSGKASAVPLAAVAGSLGCLRRLERYAAKTISEIKLPDFLSSVCVLSKLQAGQGLSLTAIK